MQSMHMTGNKGTPLHKEIQQQGEKPTMIVTHFKKEDV